MEFSTFCIFFFFSSRRRHTRFDCGWSSDVCSSDLETAPLHRAPPGREAISEPVPITVAAGDGQHGPVAPVHHPLAAEALHHARGVGDQYVVTAVPRLTLRQQAPDPAPTVSVPRVQHLRAPLRRAPRPA